ncbi:ABC transporter substrate-binding protein [Aeromicrobium camelliae]|uniref:ABC transporter substrate-binding protein n=2 Tax=Aeromicrobium TaxID=2040 RepID=A0A3N6YJN7_9ACTN|nr:ABC transporter substrate-binding protein [Aeromicrobium camelliae]RQN09994.1 ABC transporter substrate-binding protein [Aeromicrobium camelliae]
MRTVRTTLLTGAAALALALSGCGSSSDDASEDGGSSGETRDVVDATGAEVTVPADPQRIVTLHYAATQPILDLGLADQLVGQGVFEPGIIPEDLADTVEDIPVVAENVEPKLEEIAALEPDLILVPNVLEEEVTDQLAAVAPVYTFTLRGGDRANWGQRTEEVADATNTSDRVDELEAEFEERQQSIAEEYADVIEGKTVAVLGAYEENNFYAWGESNMMGTLLMPLGFTWSEQENAIVEGQPEPEATVSNEKLTSAVGDADLLFLDSNLRAEPNAFMTALQETALYQDLPAVQAGHAWFAGKNTVAGYTDAHYTLDRVEEALQALAEE